MGENQEVPVRGPVRPVRAVLHDRSRRPSVHTDQANCTRGGSVRDLPPIRGNGGDIHLPGRKCELQRFRSVTPAAPQRVIRIDRVGDPLSVSRIGEIEGSDAGQQRKELFRVSVVADQFTPLLHANRKNLLSIPAGNCIAVGKRTISKLNRMPRRPQKPGLHRQGPEVNPLFVATFVDNVSAIGCPSSTANFSCLAAVHDGVET